jgi:2-polyprenyl-3-methyl-5-hydroxy-6-metoxy-1,4-benzoquinol methylase
VQYDFSYADSSTYAAVRQLLSRFTVDGGLVVDLGCGNCPMAEVVRELGATYVGVDVDPDSVALAAERGIESHVVDLSGPDAGIALNKVVGDRRVAAVLALDVLEHLVDPAALLRQLHEHVVEARTALLLSVPNVTHIDLGGKLLTGRWDVTPTGLLDETHLRFFTSGRLDQVLRAAGWHEIDRRDFRLAASDQHFPVNHPALAPGALLAEELRLLRAQADEFGDVNQFVRAYLAGPVPAEEPEPEPGPFLSIVMRTQGAKPDSMIEALCCLGGQTVTDWELIIAVHGDADRLAEVRALVDDFDGELRSRIRLTSVTGGGRARPANRGLELATGSYVAFLDDDDFVTADWVETFQATATKHAGSIVRSFGVDRDVEPAGTDHDRAPYQTKSGLRPTFTTEFDLVQHLYENRTPLHCFAVPRTVVTELNVRWNDELLTCEDWDFLLRCALWCGVTDTGAVTTVYNRWHKVASLHTVPQWSWDTARQWVRHHLDSRPLLLPPGSVTRLAELYEASLRETQPQPPDPALLAQIHQAQHRAELAEHAAHHLQLRVTSLEKSTSWRITAPLRYLMRKSAKSDN